MSSSEIISCRGIFGFCNKQLETANVIRISAKSQATLRIETIILLQVQSWMPYCLCRDIVHLHLQLLLLQYEHYRCWLRL